MQPAQFNDNKGSDREKNEKQPTHRVTIGNNSNKNNNNNNNNKKQKEQSNSSIVPIKEDEV